MRIGIDMDGVLADFDKAWVDRWNADFGTDIEYKHCDHWDALTSLTGVTYDEWWTWAKDKHEDLFLNAVPLPGAVEGVNLLKARGHDIVIITAKPRWAAGHPSSWLDKHGVAFDELHVTTKKTFVLCDVYVDDALHNIEDFLEVRPEALSIQYHAWPYVNNGETVEGAVVCTSWPEVVERVEEYWLLRRSLESRVTQARERTRPRKHSFKEDSIGLHLQTH